jgi:single-strand DNA-binding protein
MASLNKVMLLGNLTRDPEIKYLPSGTAVADIGLAINRRFRTQQGEDKEETCFVSVEVWGRQAETCGEYLSKGSPLLVEGRLKYEEWERDGKKNSRLKVVAERTQFVGGRRSEGGGGGSAPSASHDQGMPSAPMASDELPGDDDDLPF